jgi:hypothetical protein
MFNTIPIKTPMTFITVIDKSTWSLFGNTTDQGNTEKKSNVGGITIPNFKLYYRAIEIKITWYWYQNRYEDQWNRIEDQTWIHEAVFT